MKLTEKQEKFIFYLMNVLTLLLIIFLILGFIFNLNKSLLIISLVLLAFIIAIKEEFIWRKIKGGLEED